MADIHRILVTGGSGQLGQALVERKWADAELITPDSTAFDLSKPDSLAAQLEKWAPDAIINAAAHTAVDKAESEADLAMVINGKSPAILAAYCASKTIPLIHISTDYVFPGDKQGRYDEADPTAPLSVYGDTKVAGERAITDSGARAIIIRTAWVVSPFAANFLKTMVRLGQEREALSVVDDQHGSPTSAQDLAQAVQTIALTMLHDPSRQGGIYHFSNSGATTWHGVAAHIFDWTARNGLKSPKLSAIASSEYPTAAKRPANSLLDTTKITSDFGIVPRRWQSAIDAILEQLGRAD